MDYKAMQKLHFCLARPNSGSGFFNTKAQRTREFLTADGRR